MEALARREAERPFDLETGPLVRATLLRLAPDEHVFLLTLHHIVADGWAAGLFVRELAALYRALREGSGGGRDARRRRRCRRCRSSTPTSPSGSGSG